ncbi:MAG: helix-turn-helix domain-containing protein, partial [Serpentinimonas sp.]|nr:helix-turn-helix domain-containing protein [Serpentinimonas sp.]
EDLFHRLNVIRLRLPPLRERREDVPLLTRFFVQQSAKQLGVDPKRISTPALNALAAFDFPGNVRQLENICHWLTVMAPAQVVERKDLPPEVLQAVGPAAAGLGVAQAPGASAAAAAQASGAAATHAALAAPRLEAASAAPAAHGGKPAWEADLYAEAHALLQAGRNQVWDALLRRFEAQLLEAALAHTHGRRIEAAQQLGIGRNTLTRKLQELGLG